MLLIIVPILLDVRDYIPCRAGSTAYDIVNATKDDIVLMPAFFGILSRRRLIVSYARIPQVDDLTSIIIKAVVPRIVVWLRPLKVKVEMAVFLHSSLSATKLAALAS